MIDWSKGTIVKYDEGPFYELESYSAGQCTYDPCAVSPSRGPCIIASTAKYHDMRFFLGSYKNAEWFLIVTLDGRCGFVIMSSLKEL